MEPLEYSQIQYNEPVLWLEERWGRKLNPHEKNIAIMIYRYTRTSQEAEEIKILDVDKPVSDVDKFGKVCCICADEPERVSLTGKLFCNSCFNDIYL